MKKLATFDGSAVSEVGFENTLAKSKRLRKRMNPFDVPSDPVRGPSVAAGLESICFKSNGLESIVFISIGSGASGSGGAEGIGTSGASGGGGAVAIGTAGGGSNNGGGGGGADAIGTAIPAVIPRGTGSGTKRRVGPPGFNL